MSSPTRRSLFALPAVLPLLGVETDHDKPIFLENPGFRITFDAECFVPLAGNYPVLSTPNQLLQHTHRLAHQVRMVSSGVETKFTMPFDTTITLGLSRGNQSLGDVGISIGRFERLWVPKHPDRHPTGVDQRHFHLKMAWVINCPVAMMQDTFAPAGKVLFRHPDSQSEVTSVRLRGRGLDRSFRVTRGCFWMELQANESKKGGKPEDLKPIPAPTPITPACLAKP